MSKIVIVGGGVIGCAIAERLSRERAEVVLLERERIAAHASGAAAGLLAPHDSGDAADEAEGARSLALFPELVRRVAESGIDVEYREGETIRPALTAADERRLQEGPGRWLTADEARELEPALQDRLRGASVVAEAQITPPRFVEALSRTAVAQGAVVREGTPVGQLVTLGGRMRGVQTPDGFVEADWVV
ncbi:MAG: FAD-dependent oxidoreductase, partial [Candidatus Dormiibacterota bacterium]